MTTSKPLISHRHELRVRFADTDQMQIVYNGRYFEYFEIGRTELLRDLGLPYKSLEETGIRLVVIESYCRYLVPALYDDIITVESMLFALPTARMRIDYNIYRGGTLLVTGFTAHAFQDFRTLKPVRPPAFFLETLKKGFAVD
jgi:acyl-CoA thioester hydrolase